MRRPLRWRIRTLLLAVLVIGLCIGGVALRRRSERLSRMAREYAEWDERLARIMPILDDSIARERDMAALAEREMRVAPGLDRGRLGGHRSRLEHRIAVRSKFSELREYARQQERSYSSAARQPWRIVADGRPIGPRAEALRDEFFAPTARP